MRLQEAVINAGFLPFGYLSRLPTSDEPSSMNNVRGSKFDFELSKEVTVFVDILTFQANENHTKILLTAVMIFAELANRALHCFETKLSKSKPLNIDGISNGQQRLYYQWED